jgi:hypothetical protein
VGVARTVSEARELIRWLAFDLEHRTVKRTHIRRP